MLVNYLSDVLPWKRKLTAPLCVRCNWDAYREADAAGQAEQYTPLQDAFPWVNYLFWPRRCPRCSRGRGLRVWIVEGVYIALALWLWSNAPEKLGFWQSFCWMVYFGVVVVIDLEYRLILHPVSLFGAAAGLATGIYLRGWVVTLLGGVVGFAIMFVLYWLAGVFLTVAGKLRGQCGSRVRPRWASIRRTHCRSSD